MKKTTGSKAFQGLLGKKKKRGVLQNLARMNMMKGLGAMGKGLRFRRK
jgi:hypothetical protein